MSRFAVILLGILCFSLPGCRGKRNGSTDPEASNVVGRWEASKIVIEYNALGGDAKRMELDADQAKNQNRRPQLTVIEPRGTFREEQWSLSDSLLSSKKGFWHQFEDSLYFNYEQEGGARSAYGVEFGASFMKLSALVDFDGDGQRDDRITLDMVRRRD